MKERLVKVKGFPKAILPPDELAKIYEDELRYAYGAQEDHWDRLNDRGKDILTHTIFARYCDLKDLGRLDLIQDLFPSDKTYRPLTPSEIQLVAPFFKKTPGLNQDDSLEAVLRDLNNSINNPHYLDEIVSKVKSDFRLSSRTSSYVIDSEFWDQTHP